MGILKRPYELSVWEDRLENGSFVEHKLCIIGTEQMTSQSRAMSPKLVTNTNGTVTFTFSMYYKYRDNTTGEEVNNPFIQYMTNERKLKLKYDDKWYDLIIKNMKKDSTKYCYDISTTDQHINELSKNGFNTTLDSTLNNNVGNIKTLGATILNGTDWEIDDSSNFIPDLNKEALIKCNVTTAFTATQLDDTTSGVQPSTSLVTIPLNATIYAFYSCCANKSSRFQFYYFPNGTTIEKNSERLIQNTGCQYYVDDWTYATTSYSTYGVYTPDKTSIQGISGDYRGARYVFSPDTMYKNIFDKYVSVYSKNNTDYYGYSTTEYIAPNFIQNVSTNPNAFRDTSGWKAGVIYSSSTQEKAKLEKQAWRKVGNTIKSFKEEIQASAAAASNTYISTLDFAHTQTYQIVVNTGFYDNRSSIKNLVKGDKYQVQYKFYSPSGATIEMLIGQYPYDATNGYTLTGTDAHTFAKCDLIVGTTLEETRGWIADPIIIGEGTGVVAPTFTEKGFKKQSGNKVYIILRGKNGAMLPADFKIIDFEIFKYIPNGSTASGVKHYIHPDDQPTDASIVTTYYLYNKNAIDNATADQTIGDFNPVWTSTTQTPLDAGYTQPLSCEKRRSITAKESNCFNMLQTLGETFEAWVNFNVGHNTDGKITTKKIKFTNSIGTYNYAGFRYGVNLKSVQRTDDSANIVTKLIVKQNSNKYGKNGFCTIARAPSNETGENYIYDMNYYITQGLLSASDWTILSSTHYSALREKNSDIQKLNELLLSQSIVLTKAQSDLTIYETGRDTANDQLEEDANKFSSYFDGTSWKNASAITPTDKLNSKIGLLEACVTDYQAWKDYDEKAKKQDKIVNGYDEGGVHHKGLKETYQDYQTELNTKLSQKQTLVSNFFAKISRYVQEGTWTDNEYLDDEKYYIDAVSTAYNSSMPKVTYSISVMELSALTGYEGFRFQLGDRTYVEDPEFFGYDSNGNPYREQVVLTEITYNLDDPDKDSIKIQNFKNGFQDLFKKINATVQSVKYSTGAYEKAADLANASDAQKSSFLKGAMNDASNVLYNLANQTVKIDDTGLTITNGLNSNKILRAVSGGFLITEDGGNTWLSAITSKGISAKTITSGVLNTGVVNIMSGDSPTFRWDAYGLTAYDFTQSGNTITTNEKAGVRFDRFGVYKYRNVPTYDWTPTSVAKYNFVNESTPPALDSGSLRNYSQFELANDGLYLSLGGTIYNYYIDGQGKYHYNSNGIAHAPYSALGKVSPYIYNQWSAAGIPYYDINKSGARKFVKIFSVGTSAGGAQSQNEQLAIYDDGTLVANKIKLTGDITWTDASSPTKNLYGSNKDAAAPTGSWSTFDNDTGNWHKNYHDSARSEEPIWYADKYYYHTENAGASWQGPMLITNGFDTVTTQFAISDSRIDDPATIGLIVNWTSEYPTTDDYKSKFICERTGYSNGGVTPTTWTLTRCDQIANDGKAWSINLSNDFASMSTEYDGTADPNWSAECSVSMIHGDAIDDISNWTWSLTTDHLECTSSGAEAGDYKTYKFKWYDSPYAQDNASAVITATNNSDSTLKFACQFNASKVKTGTPGQDYSLIINQNIIGRDVNKDLKNTSFTIDTSNKYSDDTTVNIYKNSSESVIRTYNIAANDNPTKIYTLVRTDPGQDNTKLWIEDNDTSVTVKWVYGDILLDKETISILSETKGDPGTTSASTVSEDIYKLFDIYSASPVADSTWSTEKPQFGSPLNNKQFIYKAVKITYTAAGATEPSTVSYSTSELIEACYWYSATTHTPEDKYVDYAQYIKNTDNETHKCLTYTANGELYINATYINTGELKVEKEGDVVFYACIADPSSGHTQGEVKLAGWYATANRLGSSSGDNPNVYLYSGNEATYEYPSLVTINNSYKRICAGIGEGTKSKYIHNSSDFTDYISIDQVGGTGSDPLLWDWNDTDAYYSKSLTASTGVKDLQFTFDTQDTNLVTHYTCDTAADNTKTSIITHYTKTNNPTSDADWIYGFEYFGSGDLTLYGKIGTERIYQWRITPRWESSNYLKTIKLSKFVINYKTIIPNFCVLDDGSVYLEAAKITGKVYSGEGQIGGWKIDNNSLYYGADSEHATMFLNAAEQNDYYHTVCGRSGKDWMIKAGDNFGVTYSGALYSQNGIIGGWTILLNELKNTIEQNSLYYDSGMASTNLTIYPVTIKFEKHIQEYFNITYNNNIPYIVDPSIYYEGYAHENFVWTNAPKWYQQYTSSSGYLSTNDYVPDDYASQPESKAINTFTAKQDLWIKFNYSCNCTSDDTFKISKISNGTTTTLVNTNQSMASATMTLDLKNGDKLEVLFQRNNPDDSSISHHDAFISNIIIGYQEYLTFYGGQRLTSPFQLQSNDAYYYPFMVNRSGSIYAEQVNMQSGVLGTLSQHGVKFDKTGIYNSDSVISNFESILWIGSTISTKYLNDTAPLDAELKTIWELDDTYGAQNSFFSNEIVPMAFATGVFNNSGTGICKLTDSGKQHLLSIVPVYCKYPSLRSSTIKNLWNYGRHEYTYNDTEKTADFGNLGTGLSFGTAISYLGDICLYKTGIYFANGYAISDSNWSGPNNTTITWSKIWSILSANLVERCTQLEQRILELEAQLNENK